MAARPNVSTGPPGCLLSPAKSSDEPVGRESRMQLLAPFWLRLDLRHPFGLSSTQNSFVKWEIFPFPILPYLFPAKNPKSNYINNYHPSANQPDLRQDVDKVLAFGGNEANAVDYWGKRQERRNIL